MDNASVVIKLSVVFPQWFQVCFHFVL